MLNIIILYHYVMCFLVIITIFTFIFIFLSFFRSYFFFFIRTEKLSTYTKIQKLFQEESPKNWYKEVLSFIRTKLIDEKVKNLDFYKKDLKASLKDQITHAPLLEFLWVIFPALILVAIAYPSIIMLYYNESYVDPVFNITIIGNQWYWTYEYNDFNLVEIFKKHISSEQSTLITTLNDFTIEVTEFNSKYKNDKKGLLMLQEFDQKLMDSIPRRITIDSNMILTKDPKFLRLLATDQCLVIPSKTPIRLMVTSNDVIHSWAVPSFGVKLDAVPGRINQQIINVPVQGVSWGQCSELCGVNHAYMPIEVKVVSFNDFLFFMELRIKEVLTPYFVEYYKERTRILTEFCLEMQEGLAAENHEYIVELAYLKKFFLEEKVQKFKQFLNKI